MSNLAYIGMVTEVLPIPGADRIESLSVVCGTGGKWRGTAVKGEFAAGSLCEVYLQDAVLPEGERYDFMEKYGRRVRMVRLRGVPSECLIMPLSELTQGYSVGTDIETLVGVTKYEKPVPTSIAGEMAGVFPWFIPKTDEPNFQRVPYMIEALRGSEYYATVKADGSSGTIYWKDGELHCCSRNYELRDRPSAAVWQIARKYNLVRLGELCPDLALQFEIVGPSIQGNPLGLGEVDMRLFNVYDMSVSEYVGMYRMMSVAHDLGIPTVDFVVINDVFNPDSDEDLRKLAECKYANGRQAEGIVVRPLYPMRVGNERLSFKVLNLLYKEQ